MAENEGKIGAPGSEVELPVTWGDVVHYLRGCEFPISRDDLVAYARYHGGTPGLVADLKNMEDREYQNLDDVKREFEKQVR